jgi:hypothetical protein
MQNNRLFRSGTNLLIVFLWTCLVAFSTAYYSSKASGIEQPESSYFPMNKGDCWKYKCTLNVGEESRTKEVELSMTDLADGRLPDGSIWHEMERSFKSEVSSIPASKFWYIETDGWILHSPDNKSALGYKELKIPIVPGFHWDARPSYQKMIPGPLSATPVGPPSREGTVSGPEEIVVPAGKFQALKVQTHYCDGCMPLGINSWYAPDVGLVKREMWGGPNSLMELTEYLLSPEDKKQKLNIAGAIR